MNCVARILFFFAVCLLSASQALCDHHNDVYGAWDLTLQTNQGPRPSWVKLFKEQDAAVAEFVGTGGGKNRASDVKVDGDSFQWTIGQATYHAKLADGKLTGKLVRGDRQVSFTGQPVIRKADLTGRWDVAVDVGDQTRERVLELKQDGQNVTGTYGGGQFPKSELQDVDFRDGQLSYKVRVQTNNGPFTVNYQFDVRGDQMSGTASLQEGSWEGAIQATRRREWNDPVPLISDDGLSNWDFQQVGEKNQWKVVDGVLVNEGRGWNIFTKQKFKDYKLSIDVRVPARGNSGIYLNGRYEVQVADTHGRPASKGGMGAIYGRAVPTANPSKPAGEWQTFEIKFVNYWATVVLNGTTIVDNVLIEGITGGALDSNESEPGPLMLQGDHGPIEYRNIEITTLAR